MIIPKSVELKLTVQASELHCELLASCRNVLMASVDDDTIVAIVGKKMEMMIYDRLKSFYIMGKAATR